MFYFLELYYRSLFYFIFNSALLPILYYNKELIIWVIVFPFNFNKKFQNHFIYTHPTEIFNIIIYLIFFIFLMINIIYVFFIFLDFSKTSINVTKFMFFKKLSFVTFILTIIFNLIFLLYIIPFLFVFFESYNNEKNFCFDLIMELRIESYTKFFITSLITSNLVFFFILLILLFICSFNFGLFLKNKKFFILTNILLATLFSPPDIISQIIIFFFLTFLLEIILLFLLFKIKFNMVTY